MAILAEYSFAYRWPSSTNFNFAMMGLNLNLVVRNNKIYAALLISSNETSSVHTFVNRFHPFESGTTLKRLANKTIFDFNSIQLFHTSLFDPIWACRPSINNSELFWSATDFIKEKPDNEFNPNEFFPGAFTYRLHLTHLLDSKIQVSEKSYFRYFETYFEHFLEFINNKDITI